LKAEIDLLRASGSGQPTTSTHHPQDQMESVTRALELGLARNDLADFYRLLRSTDLPFLPAASPKDTKGLFRRCFELVHRLGSVSPAAGLAVENHLYVTSAIATVPVGAIPRLEQRRRLLLQTIASRRLLVANTNSYLHGASLGSIGVRAQREGKGFRINGKASYVSLASQADLLIFVAVIENEGPAIFVADPMQGNPGLVIGNLLFPSAMVDSDTRQVSFQDLHLAEESLLAGGNPDLVEMLVSFEMIWHELLLPALYLGAAARAIDEARKFLRATTRDGRPLAELDGMIVDMGRLAIEYESSRCVVLQGGEALAEIGLLPRDMPKLEKALMLASAAKYTGTRSAEALVTAARRIIGGRSFINGHPLERLSQEVMFAVLSPEVSASIERDFGQQTLKDQSFMDANR
jgi:alkylation response protein AidB-like acyl-CoA dehydrogenase